MLSEVNMLLVLSASGILIGLIFDSFRILRKIFKMPDFMIYIQDVLFWIISGLIIIYILCGMMPGEIRLYMILVIILSAVFYFLIISKYIILISMKIVSTIKAFLSIIYKPFKYIKSKIKKEKFVNFKNFLKK